MKMTTILLSSFFYLVTPAYAHGPEDCNMWPWMMHWGQGMAWVMPLMMMVFWVAVIVGIIIFIRWTMHKSGKGSIAVKPDSPLEVLKRRYAKGEINKDEFERIKKDIS